MNNRTVASVMTTDVLYVGPDLPVKEVAELLTSHRIGAVPVVDGAHQVIGVVSETDLVHILEPVHRHHWPARRSRASATVTAARELMSSPPVTIPADAELSAVAKKMADHRIKRLPVVDANLRLVGIVSQHDLLGVFVRPDAAIRAEIVDEVVARALGMPPTAIDVQVRDGVVTLHGQVERRGLVAMAMELARRVDGVVDVLDQLSYARDDRHPEAGPDADLDLMHDLWTRRPPF